MWRKNRKVVNIFNEEELLRAGFPDFVVKLLGSVVSKDIIKGLKILPSLICAKPKDDTDYIVDLNPYISNRDLACNAFSLFVLNNVFLASEIVDIIESITSAISSSAAADLTKAIFSNDKELYSIVKTIIEVEDKAYEIGLSRGHEACYEKIGLDNRADLY